MNGNSFAKLVDDINKKFGGNYLPLGILVDPELEGSKKLTMLSVEDLLALKQKGTVND